MWQLTVTLSQIEGQLFSDSVEDDALSVSWFENPDDIARWSIHVHFDNEPSPNRIRAWFDAAGISGCDYGLDCLDDRDWLSENRSSFPPIEVGPFYIYGSHHAENPRPPETINFLIDAAAAFGTGQHGTTKGCLMALWALKKAGKRFENPLDMGCGTAILAMAIARLFDVPVMASDNDPDALEVVKTNLALNKLDHLITPIEASGLSNDVLKILAPYDLIVANILADPLIELAQDIYDHTAPDGTLILSGILKEQESRVLDAYKIAGFSFDHSTIWDDQWVAIVLRRGD